MDGNDLRRARETLGYSQSGLADALYMGANGADAIRKMEKGKREITGPVQAAVECMLRKDG